MKERLQEKREKKVNRVTKSGLSVEEGSSFAIFRYGNGKSGWGRRD